MASYRYTAITEQGLTVRGVLSAESEDAARNLIASQGGIPTDIRPQRGSFSLASLNDMRFFARVKPRELILFTKQFKAMFKAGIPMVRLFTILSKQSENPLLSEASRTISNNLQQGVSLYEAFSSHPKIFSPLYCSMLRAGERGGILPDILDRLLYIIDHEYQVRRDILSALTYPAIVTGALIVAFFILLIQVVPRFVSVFTSAGITLPLPTRICIALYTFLINYYPFLIGSALLIAATFFFYLRTEKGKLTRDRVLLTVPLIGPILQRAAMSRFASILGMLLSSGVSVLEALSVLTGTIGNRAVAMEIEGLRSDLKHGRGLSEPLSRSKLFPPMLTDMVAVGEESGELDELLKEVSQHYDYEVEFAVARMSSMLGPILIVGLAAVVGFFAMAIFLPMTDLSRAAMTQMRGPR